MIAGYAAVQALQGMCQDALTRNRATNNEDIAIVDAVTFVPSCKHV